MKSTACLLFLPLLLPVSALAQGGQQSRIVLQALDTDGDGQLSSAEIAAAPASLAKLDKNHDGQITPDEYNPKLDDKTAGSDLVTRLMVMDRNGDGVLEKDEVPERMQAMFDRGDTNHDGKLTPEEIRAMSATQTDPQGRAIERGHAEGMLRMDPVMNAIDTDHDGVFSAAEIASAPGALATLDKDADGTLSQAELRPRQQTTAERVDHLLGEWDTNKDGVLTKAEMPDRMQAEFDAIDLNHDGKADREELMTYMATQPTGRPGGPGAPTGERQRPPRERMPQNDSQPAGGVPQQ